MTIIRKILLTLLMTAVAAILKAQSPTTDADCAWVEEVPYVQIVVTENDYIRSLLPDSVFYSTAGSLIYPVNIFTLPRRAPLLQDIDDIIVPMAKSNDWSLFAIHLRGAASPEGPERWNRTLGERRAKSLLDYLAARLPESENAHLIMDNGVEDYIGLCHYLNKSRDVDVGRVSEIVERNFGNNAETKRQLKALDKGKVWKRLLRDVYPQLRAARIILYFRPNAVAKKRKEIDPVDVLADIDPRLADVGFPIPMTIGPLSNIDYRFPTVELPPLEEKIRRHLLSVSTNLAYDAFWMPHFGMAPMPNIELEYYPKRGNWTYLAALTFPYWHKWGKNKFFQIRDYHLEARRYFKEGDLEKGTLHTGPFLAAYLNNNIYGIGLSKRKGWQGEGLGAAAKAGYVWKLDNTGRWRIELCAAFGGYLTRYDPYVYGNPLYGNEDGLYYYDYTGRRKDFTKRNYQRLWFGPTEFGVKLRYDLLYRRIQKKGVGFKRKEVAR